MGSKRFAQHYHKRRPLSQVRRSEARHGIATQVFDGKWVALRRGNNLIAGKWNRSSISGAEQNQKNKRNRIFKANEVCFLQSNQRARRLSVRSRIGYEQLCWTNHLTTADREGNAHTKETEANTNQSSVVRARSRPGALRAQRANREPRPSSLDWFRNKRTCFGRRPLRQQCSAQRWLRGTATCAGNEWTGREGERAPNQPAHRGPTNPESSSVRAVCASLRQR